MPFTGNIFKVHSYVCIWSLTSRSPIAYHRKIEYFYTHILKHIRFTEKLKVTSLTLRLQEEYLV